jgi:hypothetical protein
MTIELNPEQELPEQEEWLSVSRSDVDARIRNGIAQLEHGEGIPEDELDEYLLRLKAQQG